MAKRWLLGHGLIIVGPQMSKFLLNTLYHLRVELLFGLLGSVARLVLFNYQRGSTYGFLPV